MKYDIFFFCSFVGPRGHSLFLRSNTSYAYTIQRYITACDYTHVQFNSYSFGKIMTIYRIKWMAARKKCVSFAETGEAHSFTHTHRQTHTHTTHHSRHQLLVAPSTSYCRRPIEWALAENERRPEENGLTDEMRAKKSHGKMCIYAEFKNTHTYNDARTNVPHKIHVYK